MGRVQKVQRQGKSESDEGGDSPACISSIKGTGVSLLPLCTMLVRHFMPKFICSKVLVLFFPVVTMFTEDTEYRHFHWDARKQENVYLPVPCLSIQFDSIQLNSRSVFSLRLKTIPDLTLLIHTSLGIYEDTDKVSIVLSWK